MNKSVLIDALHSETRSKELCQEVADATFELLAEMVTLEESLVIEGIGTLGAHRRRKANKERPNTEGVVACKNLSIFFHPSKAIKKVVSDLVEDDPEH